MDPVSAGVLALVTVVVLAYVIYVVVRKAVLSALREFYGRAGDDPAVDGPEQSGSASAP